MASYRAALIIAFLNDLLLYTRLALIIWMYTSRYSPAGVLFHLKRRLIPDVLWLPSTLGVGFYFSILIQDESFHHPLKEHLIFVSLQWLYLEAFTISRVQRCEWNKPWKWSFWEDWASLAVAVSMITCLVSLLAWICFVIFMLKVPQSDAQTTPWPYGAQHNQSLRLIVLTPVWASWLSRCFWVLPGKSSKPILIANLFVACSSSFIAGISTFYAIRKDGSEQLTFLSTLNLVYIMHEHIALLFFLQSDPNSGTQNAGQLTAQSTTQGSKSESCLVIPCIPARSDTTIQHEASSADSKCLV